MPKSRPLVKPIAAIVCDDIRQEHNLKDILIGVYSADLTLKRVPAQLRLCVYIIAEIGRSGKGTYEVALNGPDGSSLNAVKMDLESTDENHPKNRVGLPCRYLVIKISKEGDLTVKFRPEGGRWSTVGVLPVKFAEDAVISSSET